MIAANTDPPKKMLLFIYTHNFHQVQAAPREGALAHVVLPLVFGGHRFGFRTSHCLRNLQLGNLACKVLLLRRRRMDYWWRSHFSRLTFNDFKLTMRIVFDFATSIF